VFQVPKHHLEKDQGMWILLVGGNGRSAEPQFFLLCAKLLAPHLSLGHCWNWCKICWHSSSHRY